MMHVAEVKRKFYQFSGYVGWMLIVGFSLLLFILPTQARPSPEIWLFLVLGALLLSWIGLIAGVNLLIFRYLSFFQRIKGVLLFLGLFMIGIRLFGFFITVENSSWLLSHLFIVLAMWIFTLPVVLFIALCIYLWYQDHSVRLVAVTFLIVIWAFVFYVRSRTAEQLLLDAIQMGLPGELSALVCLSQMLFILAPLFFFGHSLRLLYRELSRAGMYDTLPSSENSEGKTL